MSRPYSLYAGGCCSWGWQALSPLITRQSVLMRAQASKSVLQCTTQALFLKIIKSVCCMCICFTLLSRDKKNLWAHVVALEVNFNFILLTFLDKNQQLTNFSLNYQKSVGQNWYQDNIVYLVHILQLKSKPWCLAWSFISKVHYIWSCRQLNIEVQNQAAKQKWRKFVGLHLHHMAMQRINYFTLIVYFLVFTVWFVEN